MKHPIPRHVPLLIAAVLPLAVSCTAGPGGGTYTNETYSESEINDTAPLADYFGVLRPGDHFFIDGNITDIPFDPYDPWNGYDPFDGFAFTANQPLHVEFTLWIDNVYGDLDVVVYDPQIDQEVGWFESSDNPEIGSVDVFAGGLDFHLVVESYIGISDYSLEIRVYRLNLDEGGGAAPGVIAPDGSPAAPGIASDRVVDPSRPEREAGAFAEYHPAAAPEGALEERVMETETDPVTGEVRATSHALDADG